MDEILEYAGEIFIITTLFVFGIFTCCRSKGVDVCARECEPTENALSNYIARLNTTDDIIANGATASIKYDALKNKETILTLLEFNLTNADLILKFIERFHSEILNLFEKYETIFFCNDKYELMLIINHSQQNVIEHQANMDKKQRLRDTITLVIQSDFVEWSDAGAY